MPGKRQVEGVELSAFGGSEVAEDYEDLRSALGYEQWNWYGASYGGRIGQILLRQYPERLRSVFLASPAVVGATDHGAKAFGEALDQLFSSCRADSRCSREYPRLAEDFDVLMARLEATPVTLRAPSNLGFPGDRFVVNRNVALFAIQKGLSGDAFPAVLPALVTAAARGNEDPLYGLLEHITGAWMRTST
jgi:pimeloyl-ACP methyl ester carboxylesterase